MIDPVSATEIALSGLAKCVKAVKLLKRTIENVKHVKDDIIGLVRETERYRNVLGLLCLMTRELQRSRYSDMELSIDKDHISRTLDTLLKVASNIAETVTQSGQIIAGLHWTFKKTEAQKLANRMHEEQANLMTVVGLINATATLRSLHDFECMKADTENNISLVAAFNDQSLNKTPDNVPVRTWLAHISTDTFPPEYNKARSNLADAAYIGDWTEVFRMLQHGRHYYQENWVNAFRIKPLAMHHLISRWTILHQAAFSNAPSEVVAKLVDQGAYRRSITGDLRSLYKIVTDIKGTLRTQYTSSSYSDQTPVEIAMEQGHTSLLKPLAPVIRSPVPNNVLGRIERQFHDLIRKDLEERVEQEHFYLPTLEVMTELDAEAVWLEIKQHQFDHAGYWFRLDGRDLLVRSVHIQEPRRVKDYRITPYQIQAVEDAFLVNDHE